MDSTLTALFHPFAEIPADTILPKLFNCPFCYTPHPLAVEAANCVQRYLETRTDWADEIAQGKMFGVLVVQDRNGQLGFLAAFSGNIGGRACHRWFVPPIFDITAPDGRFKTEERSISDINRQIESIAKSESNLLAIKKLNEVKQQAEKEIGQAKAAARLHKADRDARRRQELTPEQSDKLIRQSQFEKAELKRLERQWAAKIADAEAEASALQAEIARLKEQRRQKSEELQAWLFDQYVVLNARGERKTVSRIFADERGCEPPAAAGECAAPKLLQFAFRQGLKPLTMAEFWWGAAPAGEVRRHGQFYPACHSKCEPILNFMLQGLDVEPNPLRRQPAAQLKILYNDEWIAAIDKPAGLPSVPGKEHSASVGSMLRGLFPDASEPMVVHRLDMATSGILLIAKTKDVYVTLQRQFSTRAVKKRYVALLDGVLKDYSGLITLPLRLNPDDRPCQMVDFEHGKPAVTRYSVIGKNGNRTLVNFFPETGRTHQLRVHAAHSQGLGCPIVGDNLYGAPDSRLYLHAAEIEFTHPVTGKKVRIVSEAEF